MTRNLVFWFGGKDVSAVREPFRQRGLILLHRELEPIDDQGLVGVQAVIYSLDGLELTSAREHLMAHLSLIEDHGAAIVLLAHEDSDANHLQDFLEAAGHNRISPVRTGDKAKPDHEVAELVARHQPGMPWSGRLTINVPPGLELSLSQELLLRRAFSDAEDISVEKLSEGHTADAYRVLARFIKRSLLVQPLPYFAKLGKRSKIEMELGNYREYADFSIPFYLRPNVDSARSVRGSKDACLIGNFVDGARPLWEAVEEGEFSTPLNALFDATLRGWWAQAFGQSGGEIKDRAVAAALGKQIFDHTEVCDDHLSMARKLGLTRAPLDIFETLRDRRTESFFQAPFHADLHPDNVFVRNGDAIVIDLGSARMGPIAGDPACLEVALAFDVRSSDLCITTDEWCAGVKRLFAPESFDRVPLPIDAVEPWQHRLNAVRKVRTLSAAAQSCKTGYQSAIAMYLLRRSMYPAGDFAQKPSSVRKTMTKIDAHRRAYALVLAERLVFEKRGDINGPQPGKRHSIPGRSGKSPRGGSST